MIDLSAAGLTETESKCYIALLSREEWLPSELAKHISETRTNIYKVLDSLVELGLAKKFDKNKKLHYIAQNPSRLLELSRQAKLAQENAEKELETHAQSLLSEYIKVHEQPGIRYYQGQAEIREIFEEVAKAKEEVVFVHTKAGADYYGFETMHRLRMLAVNNKVTRRALTPDGIEATKDHKKTDPLVLLERTWMKRSDYTAPVEWGAFDNKVYLIAYGEDALGLVIESQPVADSFKQLFSLLERGQRSQPWYEKLPKLASNKGKTS